MQLKWLSCCLAGVFVFAPATLAVAQEGWGQFVLENKSTETGDLYVDDVYGCRALKNLFCTTQTRIGIHTLRAQWPDGQSTTAKDVVLQQGEVRTLTIFDVYKRGRRHRISR